MPSSAGSNVLLVSTFPDESSSITVVGGTRPPSPTTVGAIEPAPTGVAVGVTISVRVRLANALAVGAQMGVQPARNSCTRPLTRTSAPTMRVGRLPVKTKMPSEVRTSASGSGSWNQKPLELTAVTMPGTIETRLPSYGERCWVDWMSWMRRARPVVLNVKVWSPAMLSGGSTSSTSVTASASTLTVQVSLRWRSVCGSSKYEVDAPLGATTTATAP